jgi:hypothetical protein
MLIIQQLTFQIHQDIQFKFKLVFRYVILILVAVMEYGKRRSVLLNSRLDPVVAESGTCSRVVVHHCGMLGLGSCSWPSLRNVGPAVV